MSISRYSSSLATCVMAHIAWILPGLAPLMAASEPYAAHRIMPAPAHLQFNVGRLPVSPSLTVAIPGHDDERLRAGIGRALRRWEERTTYCWPRTPQGRFMIAESSPDATLIVDCDGPALPVPVLDEQEQYTLTITSSQAKLQAPNVIGALRGLETLLQLLESDSDGWYVPAVTIKDSPRFPWRGLMIDPVRHWMPLDVIKRNIDAMAVVKLNVLHLHLTDDQGFRIESKRHPHLHALGSDGDYYTQDQIKDLVSYAADRGIRVVPEFDIPGHATSWLVAYPELASAPGPYELTRGRGVYNPVFDPTNEKTFAFFEDFIAEMAALFPDRYFHIGGDENNGVQWNANARVQAFITSQGLNDNAGLHAYFNQRIRELLEKNGRKLVGWDEILHPEMPRDSVIHSWRGRSGIVAAAQAGFPSILSHGYYLDASRSAGDFYANDPIPVTTPLTTQEQAKVLGGEACMWSEWVSSEVIDSHIWPRAAAIAERLWSPRDTADIRDMYRRLAVVSRRLEEAGARHDVNRPAMVRRLVGDGVTSSQFPSICALIDLVQAYGLAARKAVHRDNMHFTPLTRLADCAAMESDGAREFSHAVDAFLFDRRGNDAEAAKALSATLDTWEALATTTASSVIVPSAAQDLAIVTSAFTDASRIGKEALALLTRREAPEASWVESAKAILDRHSAPNNAAVNMPFLEPVRLLIAAAIVAPSNNALTAEEWRGRIEARVLPPAP